MKDFHVRRGAHWMVVSLFLTAAGCSIGDSGIDIEVVTDNDSGNDSDNGSGVVRTTFVTVGETGNVFTPPDIVVSADATVTFTWARVAFHNVTFDAIPGASVTQNTGTFEVLMPTERRLYRYFCTIHGTAMSGSVLVQ